MRLRVAVQQQQRRARAAAAQPDAAAADRDVLQREAWEEHGGLRLQSHSNRCPPSYMQAMRPSAARS